MATAQKPVTHAVAANGTKADAADVRADLDTLKQDFSKLSADIAALTRSGLREGRVKASELTTEARERAGEAGEQIKDQAIRRRDELNDQIRAHPLAAIGIAAGAGFVLSRLMKR